MSQLAQQGRVVVDRPKDSRHPTFPSIVYPFDYGYLADTTSSDGAELDVWLGSTGRALTGIVCCVDLHKQDVEIKLLLGCNSAETATILNFHNAGDQAATLIERPQSSDE